LTLRTALVTAERLYVFSPLIGTFWLWLKGSFQIDHGGDPTVSQTFPSSSRHAGATLDAVDISSVEQSRVTLALSFTETRARIDKGLGTKDSFCRERKRKFRETA
jgi:hypothetical protein